uniref:G-patch domain-containing protein n=1 Tax=Brugia timori TaxID=42155 RepID=A0A0R3R2N5_9BILA
LKADQLGPDDPRFSVWAKKYLKWFIMDIPSSTSCFGRKVLKVDEQLSTTRNRLLMVLLSVTDDGKGFISTVADVLTFLNSDHTAVGDFLKQTNAVNSGVGLKLMQKMGWTPGEGLGKGRDGPLEPLVLDIKSDRKGLVASEELPELKKLRPNSGKNLAGKHPVSVLMELCSKKRWHAPQFTCLESGPSNNRRFLWKAVVNGVEYQPSVPSTSKKTGKAQACQVVLQSLGLVPRDPLLPQFSSHSIILYIVLLRKIIIFLKTVIIHRKKLGLSLRVEMKLLIEIIHVLRRKLKTDGVNEVDDRRF